MPFEMWEASDLNVILVRWRGRFSVEEVRRFCAEIEQCDLYHSCAPTFNDARAWDLDVPTFEMQRLARDPIAPPRGGRPRRSATVVSSDLAYGMLRVMTGLRETPMMEFEIFRDMRAAKDWLGLGHVPGDPFDRLGPS